MKSVILVLSSILLLSFSDHSFLEKSGDDIVGTWLTAEGDSHVKIYKFGGYYYGKITWLRVPNDKDGKPKKDKNNPKAEERDKGILNLLLLTGFEYKGDHEWEDGEIYDPRNGKKYDCEMWFSDENIDVLKIRGFVGVSLLGKTTSWTRVK